MRILLGAPSPDSWGGPAACEPPFAEALRAAGHQVKEVVYVYGDKVERASIVARFRRVLKTAEDLRNPLKAETFDIVHLNTSFDLKTILRDAYCIYRMPSGNHRIFLKMHGSDASGYQNAGPVVTRLIRYIARRADAIGVLSSEERGDFIALGFDESKIYRVLNVVELEGVYERSPARSDEIALLFVSRLIPAKGLVETINAAKILKDQNYSISLTVVGDGETRRDAEALASELSMDDEIRFTGYVAESEVARHLASSDIFVFPTRHIEGLPIALYKAAIAGLAIVTTPVRSARDLMSDGENCLFCESEPADIAAKIARLIGDARLMQTMADNNQKFRETLSREKVAGEYLAVYSEMVTM
ncbi:MAG: glycosyltransferase family 4 protein [Blastocatellia bacterium]|nr:glycosyltransferase family 4 protein [Blastocatellia bacterium]